ncbi:MAG: ABC transporter substrate-binding protein [Acidobacteriota bacterium]
MRHTTSPAEFNRRAFLSSIASAVPALGAAALLTGCSKADNIRLALNWKPDPQFGGFYAADYKTAGLSVEVLPGGAGTPTVQMIGAGSAEFGIVAADEIVLARSRGNDVVGLFAAFQDSPQAIMVHTERGVMSIEELLEKGGTLALQKGLPYARLLEKEYGFSHVTIVPSPGGDITAFLNDPTFAQQCFIMSEPLQAKHAGAKVTVLPVAETGYNPYTTVLATSGTLLRDKPDTAKKMVEAVRTGWQNYLKNPKPTNDRMHDLNPSMNADTFAEVAEAQKPFVENDSTSTMGLGSMTKIRWEKLIGQLQGLGDIPAAIPADDCFRSL